MKRNFNIRLNLFFFSAFAIFTIIIVRLAILQFVEGPDLSKQETNMRVKDVPLLPIRGTIYAAGGEKLAYSTPIQTLYITLQKDYSNSERGMKNRPEAVQIAEKLKEVFDKYGDKVNEPMTVDDIIKKMDLNFNLGNGYSPRLIKSGLNKQEMAYFLERKSEFPGIDIVEESVRHYNTDTIAVQTVGYLKKYQSMEDVARYDSIREANASTDKDPALDYTAPELVGADGLEMYYQEYLRGKNGYKKVPIDPRNMATGVSEIVPPVKGYDLHTNINKNIQLVAEQAIMDQIDWVHQNPVAGSVHPNAKTGYAVAMEVDTGNVVAMASMPDYDTNVWQSGKLGGIDTDEWNKIINNYQNGTVTPISSGRSGHNFESTVLLGSTIKPLSVLIGLKEGLFKTTDYYPDTGIAYFGKNNSSSVRNSGSNAYGSINPTQAILHSSNAFMVNMVGEKLWRKYPSDGIDVWHNYMKEFGLGVSTGIDLPNEFFGNLNYKNAKSETVLSRLVYASFGQQAGYTTMQLAQYTATLANRGDRMEPHIVNKITDENGNVIKEFTPTVLNKAEFKDSYWDAVINGMSTKVPAAFAGFPYDFARKTGTSEQAYKGVLQDNGVFIAFAPRKNPKLAVAVIIPEGGFGAWSAAPVARKIFDAYDREYGLEGIPRKEEYEQTENGA